MKQPAQVSVERIDRSIPVLISGAVGGVLLMLITYGVIFAHEQHAISLRQWVEHTHDVIGLMDRASRSVDQIESDRSFGGVQQSRPILERDRRQAKRLETTAFSLQTLVSDNPKQTPRIEALLLCASNLREGTASADKFLRLEPDTFEECHLTLDGLRTEEQGLLKSRSEQAQASGVAAIRMGIAYGAVSFAGMLGLFWFLIRSAFQRRRLATELQEANRGLSDTVRQLEEHAVDLNLLTLVRDELHLCVSLKEAHDSAALFLFQLLPKTSGAICLINESRNMVERVSQWGETPRMEMVPEVFSPDQCCGLRSGRSRWQFSGESEVHCAHFSGMVPMHYVCIPLSAQGEALGFVTIRCSSEGELRELEKSSDSLHQIVELTAMTIASLKLRVKLQNQSIRDPLTDLYNRSFMEIAFERELRRAVRKQSTLAVFMLDVDHFKQFNDTLGHAAGDTTLKEVAEVFRKCVRSEDIICRYGGEEFAIILPDITPEVAMERAESIRLSVSAMTLWVHEQRMPEVTISIGVAMYPEGGSSTDQLLRTADEALYRAKRGGRNKVESSMGFIPA
ncbi:diguanylate cyclase [Granulicella sp. dw_53]|uniref:diguanylate cyclase n=1 Tax=Granulicella sp. dw_53 TaxID=2719792 RepID=UPI001BD45101|nr:diguanylate cyclase [Granulicella sp. dw_53]